MHLLYIYMYLNKYPQMFYVPQIYSKVRFWLVFQTIDYHSIKESNWVHPWISDTSVYFAVDAMFSKGKVKKNVGVHHCFISFLCYFLYAYIFFCAYFRSIYRVFHPKSACCFVHFEYVYSLNLVIGHLKMWRSFGVWHLMKQALSFWKMVWIWRTNLCLCWDPLLAWQVKQCATSQLK